MARCRIAARVLEPGVLVRCVVHHEIDQHAHAALLAAMRELDEVAQCPVARIDAVVIRDVVAVVASRRGLEGHQPDRRHAEALQIVEPADQTLEVADAVPVRIHEGFDGEAVDDGVLVPEIVDHAASSAEVGRAAKAPGRVAVMAAARCAEPMAAASRGTPRERGGERAAERVSAAGAVDRAHRVRREMLDQLALGEDAALGPERHDRGLSDAGAEHPRRILGRLRGGERAGLAAIGDDDVAEPEHDTHLPPERRGIEHGARAPRTRRVQRGFGRSGREVSLQEHEIALPRPAREIARSIGAEAGGTGARAGDAVLAAREHHQHGIIGGCRHARQFEPGEILGGDRLRDVAPRRVIAERRQEMRGRAGARRHRRLVQPLAARRTRGIGPEQRLAGPRQTRQLDAEIEARIAEDEDARQAQALARRTLRMNVASRSGSTGFHHTPSRLSQLATITASATVKMSPTLSGETPEPTQTGSVVPSAIARSSSRLAASPVRWPVAMATSASKNSLSRASSPMRAVGGDRVRAVLDMHIGEDADLARAQIGAVARGFAGAAFHEALIRDIGVGPLVDAHELRARRLRDRDRLHRAVREHVDADRQRRFAPHRIRHHRHAGGGFRAEIARAWRRGCRRDSRR